MRCSFYLKTTHGIKVGGLNINDKESSTQANASHNRGIIAEVTGLKMVLKSKIVKQNKICFFL